MRGSCQEAHPIQAWPWGVGERTAAPVGAVRNSTSGCRNRPGGGAASRAYANNGRGMRKAPPRRSDRAANRRAPPPFGHRRFTAADRPVRAGITGSGPALLLLAWSATDLAREIEAGARVLGRLGIGPGTRVANTLAGALATPGALLLGDVHEALGALDVPLGTVETDAAARAAWELVDRVECEVLVLEPSTAATLFAAAPAAPRPWLRGIVWVVRGDHVVPPAVGFDGWHRIW